MPEEADSKPAEQKYTERSDPQKSPLNTHWVEQTSLTDLSEIFGLFCQEGFCSLWLLIALWVLWKHQSLQQALVPVHFCDPRCLWGCDVVTVCLLFYRQALLPHQMTWNVGKQWDKTRALYLLMILKSRVLLRTRRKLPIYFLKRILFGSVAYFSAKFQHEIEKCHFIRKDDI